MCAILSVRVRTWSASVFTPVLEASKSKMKEQRCLAALISGMWWKGDNQWDSFPSHKVHRNAPVRCTGGGVAHYAKDYIKWSSIKLLLERRSTVGSLLVENPYSNNKCSPGIVQPWAGWRQWSTFSEIRYSTNLGQVVKVGELNYSPVDTISGSQEQGAEIKRWV